MKTWTKEEQEAAFDKYGKEALDNMFAWLLYVPEDEEIIDLSRKRAFSIGYEEYGDASFHQTDDELHREKMEELADLHFRFVVDLALGEEEDALPH